MNPIYKCSICGNETFEVDMDYLVGTDHLVCVLKNIKLKTKLKIENPHHINCKNYLYDGSIVEISYMGLEERVSASDEKPYIIYKFEGYKNRSFSKIVKFELHTDIHDNKVQMNISTQGAYQLGKINVDTIKNKDDLRNYMIDEVKRF